MGAHEEHEAVAGVLREHGAESAGTDTDTLAHRIIAALRTARGEPAENDIDPGAERAGGGDGPNAGASDDYASNVQTDAGVSTGAGTSAPAGDKGAQS